MDSDLTVGSHKVLWDGTNDRGNPVSTGIYFYVLKSGDQVHTKKMVVLK